MNVQDIIHAAADDADDFLAGISSMTEARAAIREYLQSQYPGLAAPDQARAVAGVLAILEEEGFFQGSRREDAYEDAGAGGGSDDEP